MQSSAGTGSPAAARARPIALVESGPAGGVAGAARIGERIGEPNLIYLDIGGTTAKCSLVEDATVPTTTEYRIEWRPDWAGYPVMVPVVDIVEIGAGGGSIARVDAGGSIVVGPQSAGADPGPRRLRARRHRADRHGRQARRRGARARLLPRRPAGGASRARARGAAQRSASRSATASRRSPTASSGWRTRT